MIIGEQFQESGLTNRLATGQIQEMTASAGEIARELATRPHLGPAGKGNEGATDNFLQAVQFCGNAESAQLKTAVKEKLALDIVRSILLPPIPNQDIFHRLTEASTKRGEPLSPQAEMVAKTVNLLENVGQHFLRLEDLGVISGILEKLEGHMQRETVAAGDHAFELLPASASAQDAMSHVSGLIRHHNRGALTLSLRQLACAKTYIELHDKLEATKLAKRYARVFPVARRATTGTRRNLPKTYNVGVSQNVRWNQLKQHFLMLPSRGPGKAGGFSRSLSGSESAHLRRLPVSDPVRRSASDPGSGFGGSGLSRSLLDEQEHGLPSEEDDSARRASFGPGPRHSMRPSAAGSDSGFHVELDGHEKAVEYRGSDSDDLGAIYDDEEDDGLSRGSSRDGEEFDLGSGFLSHTWASAFKQGPIEPLSSFGIEEADPSRDQSDAGTEAGPHNFAERVPITPFVSDLSSGNTDEGHDDSSSNSASPVGTGLSTPFLRATAEASLQMGVGVPQSVSLATSKLLGAELRTVQATPLGGIGVLPSADQTPMGAVRIHIASDPQPVVRKNGGASGGRDLEDSELAAAFSTPLASGRRPGGLHVRRSVPSLLPVEVPRSPASRRKVKSMSPRKSPSRTRTSLLSASPSRAYRSTPRRSGWTASGFMWKAPSLEERRALMAHVSQLPSIPRHSSAPIKMSLELSLTPGAFRKQMDHYVQSAKGRNGIEVSNLLRPDLPLLERLLFEGSSQMGDENAVQNVRTAIGYLIAMGESFNQETFSGLFSTRTGPTVRRDGQSVTLNAGTSCLTQSLEFVQSELLGPGFGLDRFKQFERIMYAGARHVGQIGYQARLEVTGNGFIDMATLDQVSHVYDPVFNSRNVSLERRIVADVKRRHGVTGLSGRRGEGVSTSTKVGWIRKERDQPIQDLSDQLFKDLIRALRLEARTAKGKLCLLLRGHNARGEDRTIVLSITEAHIKVFDANAQRQDAVISHFGFNEGEKMDAAIALLRRGLTGNVVRDVLGPIEFQIIDPRIQPAEVVLTKHAFTPRRSAPTPLMAKLRAAESGSDGSRSEASSVASSAQGPSKVKIPTPFQGRRAPVKKSSVQRPGGVRYQKGTGTLGIGQTGFGARIVRSRTLVLGANYSEADNCVFGSVDQNYMSFGYTTKSRLVGSLDPFMVDMSAGPRVWNQLPSNCRGQKFLSVVVKPEQLKPILNGARDVYENRPSPVISRSQAFGEANMVFAQSVSSVLNPKGTLYLPQAELEARPGFVKALERVGLVQTRQASPFGSGYVGFRHSV